MRGGNLSTPRLPRRTKGKAAMSPSKFLSQLGPRSLALTFFCAIFGGTLLTTWHLYRLALDNKAEAIRQHVADLAVTAAALLDLEAHEQLVRPEQHDSELYRRVQAPLAAFHLRHPNIDYVFTVRETPERRQFFVLETINVPEVRARERSLGRRPALVRLLEEYRFPPGSTAADGPLRQGRAFVFPVPYRDEFGSYIEGRAPLFDRTGNYIGYVGVDYDLERYRRQVNDVRVAGGLALVLALAVGLTVARAAAGMRRRTLADRAEILRAEAEMRAQRDTADAATRAKSELLAVATHDLKNPLSAISGMSGLLLNAKRAARVPETDDEVATLAAIHESSGYMFEIVRGILNNAGLENDGLNFNPATTDLAALAGQVVRFNAALAAKKQLVVGTDLAAGLTAEVDPLLVREAFTNYVSNAIKYSPPGRTVTVTLRAAPENTVEFAVQDEGPGLQPADRPRLFGKFQKLSARPTGGELSTGLGLSVVKTVAERHSGTVGCDSEPGRGARFWLRLPRQLPAGRAAPTAAAVSG